MQTFFSPEGKGEPWHLLTCKDYAALAVIDWLAFLPEKLLVYVLCFDRAMALLIKHVTPCKDVGMLLCICSCSLGSISTHHPELARTCLSLPADSDDAPANVDLHQHSPLLEKAHLEHTGWLI